MSAQPADRIPASRPDTGSYAVIHRGGQAAVVVPVSDFLRLRALEEAASGQELEDAEDKAALAGWRARKAAAATRSRMLTTPGWTRRDEDRYSHASRDSSFGESCSIARSNRNSSRSFQRGSST
jgi:hypothetical protein